MAAQNVVICGVQFTGKSMKGEPFNFVGFMGIRDLEVGGGPVIPPALPDPPDGFPNPPGDGSIVKPPPPEGGWGWSPEHGWGYFPGDTQPGPKAQ